jgi:dolichol-phosphate mannosyltransferase
MNYVIEPNNTSLSLSIVIPAHNEQDVIEKTVRDLVAHFDKAGMRYEVLIANNNSRDRTEAILESLSAELQQVSYVNTAPLPGYGVAVRKGLDEYKNDVVVITMADGSESPEDVYELYALVDNGADCGFGTRFQNGDRTEGYPPFKLLLNRGGNRLISMLSGFNYDDYTNGFKAYRRSVIDKIQPLKGSEFELTIEMAVKAVQSGAEIGVTPNSWIDREKGESKFDVMRQCRRYLTVLFGLLFFSDRIQQFVRYFYVGVTSSLVYLLVLTLNVERFELGVTQSVMVAYFVGLVVSYVGTARFVFTSEMNPKNFSRFLVVVFISLVFNIVISELLDARGVHYLLIGIIIVAVVPLINFFSHYMWTFRGR